MTLRFLLFWKEETDSLHLGDWPQAGQSNWYFASFEVGYAIAQSELGRCLGHNIADSHNILAALLSCLRP